MSDDTENWTGASIQDLVLRSGCTITYLHLQSLPIDGSQLLSLLTSLPTIESLCIVEYDQGRYLSRNRMVTQTLLDGLTVNAPLGGPSSIPMSVLPRLTEMKLVICPQELLSQSLLRVLTSRWLPDPVKAAELGVNCLSFVAVTVFSNDKTPPQMPLDCLQCLKEAGMRLVITYATSSKLRPSLMLYPEDALLR
ncbi:hypothetical protein PM082_009024 [Marasmius tenuissimus]|nr:hypothetical protein PM082_009024 [Marasmius tenuissimus]